MGLFNNIFGNSSSKEEIQKKGMEGIIHYKNRDFKKTAIAFEEYFQLKGTGKFPDLDQDDAVMLVNLGNFKQYSSDYHGAIKTYDAILQKVPTWDAPYFMKAICLYKVGEISNAKTQWELAKRFGNDIAQNQFETEILKFK